MLGLVDHDDGVGLDRRERAEERLQRVDQLMARRAAEPRRILGDDAEVPEQLLDQIVGLEQRIVDDGQERLERQPLKDGPAQQRLARADVAR